MNGFFVMSIIMGTYQKCEYLTLTLFHLCECDVEKSIRRQYRYR